MEQNISWLGDTRIECEADDLFDRNGDKHHLELVAHKGLDGVWYTLDIDGESWYDAFSLKQGVLLFAMIHDHLKEYSVLLTGRSDNYDSKNDPGN